MAFTDNLNAAMARKGWQPCQLAAALAERGVPISEWTVRQWLAGSRAPRNRFIPHIADALGTDPNELFGFEPEPVAAGTGTEG